MALLSKKTPKFQQGTRIVTSFPHDDTAMAKGFADDRIEVRDVYEWVNSSKQYTSQYLENYAKTKGISIEEAKNQILQNNKKRYPDTRFRWNGNKFQHPKSEPAGKAYVSSSGHWYTKDTDIVPYGVDPDKKVSPEYDPRTRMAAGVNNSKEEKSKKAIGGKINRIGYNLNGGKLLLK